MLDDADIYSLDLHESLDLQPYEVLIGWSDGQVTSMKLPAYRVRNFLDNLGQLQGVESIDARIVDEAA